MPDWKTEIRARLARLNLEATREAGIVEEISQHLDDRFAESRERGASEEEARRRVMEELSNEDFLARELRKVERPKPVFLNEKKGNMMEEFLADLNYGARMLRKNPGFTAVAALTLALGIGATTAIFSAVYGVLLDPYPYGHPGEIWAPGVKTAQDSSAMRPYRRDEFEAMAKLPEFSETMGTWPETALLTGEFAPETLVAPRLSLNAFQFLEVPPVLGRVFGPGDMGAGGQPEPVTVISYRLWQRLLGGDPKAIGRTLRLDDQLYTIIGVMPPRFGWWTSDGLWLPMAKEASEAASIFPIARLKPGAGPSAARQHLHTLQLELAKANPAGFPKEKFETLLTNYLDMTVASGTMQRALRLLFAAVSFLLLIACANVASLQLSRSSTRAREMAIRLAVGAGRGRLVRQLLTESVILSAVGGALGLAFAAVLTRVLVLLMPGFYVPGEVRIEMNGYVLLFCMTVSVLTGFVFGLAPALQSSRPNLTDALKEEGRGNSSAHGGRLRSALVIAEVALSMVLLITAGLTIRSFIALENLDPGFHAEHVVTVDFTLPPARYPSIVQRNQFCAELLERVRSLPGVEAAELGNGGLPFGGPRTACSIDGQPATGVQPIINIVSADYLKTMGVALRRGQNFDERNMKRAEPVAMINEAAAKLWPAGEDPVGRQIYLDLLKQPIKEVLYSSNASPDFTVIGVFADTRNDGLASNPQPVVLIPYTRVAPPDRTLAVRVSGSLTGLMNAIRAQAKTMDPQLPLGNERTIQQALEDSTGQPRFTMVLFSLFGVIGLALAAAGIYSVLSYSVAQRTREIGVRMALGARQGDVLRLVLKDGGWLAGPGILAGALAGAGAARLLASQIELFKVGPSDLVSFLGVALLLLCVSAAACWLPARRAAKTDPLKALRYE
jgi:putative ABC transport system permease protein